MIPFLKSLLTLSNFFLLWFLLILVLYFFKRKKWGKRIGQLGVLFFLICSTNYIPRKIIASMEAKYASLEVQSIQPTKTTYIHVLGAGYDLNPKLPAVAQVSTKTLARLAEGIRVYRKVPNAILVTSGYSAYGLESQAAVVKKAAIELGIPEEAIQCLETPSTTKEEAQAFANKFGKGVQVIVVTDALHMPRAMKTFQEQGFEPIAAPTSYIVPTGLNSYNGFTLPTIQSLRLSEIVFREGLSNLKFLLGF